MTRLRVPVEEYTTPNPVTVSEETTIEDLGVVMKRNGIRHLPVVRGKTVVGIISDRDLRVVAGLNLSGKHLVKAADIMIPNPVTVRAESTLDEVAFEMSEGKIGSVIVNDENDEFLGIFTVTDALNALIEVSRVQAEELTDRD